MKTWYSMKASADNGEAEICIFSEIGGWGVNAAQFDRDLKSLGNVKTLNVKINSPGGSVIEGTMIFNLLASHQARKVVDILGWAASMASVIAMAGDVVRMPSNTYMMIHNPWMSTAGDAEQLRKDADLLDKMKSGIMGAYRRKAKGLTDEELAALLDAETWMTAAEAKAKGFADEITGEVAAAASVDRKHITMFGLGKIPDAAAKWLADETDEGKTDASGKTDDTKNDAAGKPGEPEQTGSGSGAGAQEPAVSGAPPETAASGIDAAALVTALNAKIDALNEGIAVKDGMIAALKTQIQEWTAKVSGKDAEIVALKEDNAKYLSQAQGRFDKLTHDFNDLAERHSRLVGGGLTFEADCESWPDALAKCGGDYVEARKRYPACFAAYMQAQQNKARK